MERAVEARFTRKRESRIVAIKPYTGFMREMQNFFKASRSLSSVDRDTAYGEEKRQQADGNGAFLRLIRNQNSMEGDSYFDWLEDQDILTKEDRLKRNFAGCIQLCDGFQRLCKTSAKSPYDSFRCSLERLKCRKKGHC